MKWYVKQETRQLDKENVQRTVLRVADVVKQRGLFSGVVGIMYAFMRKSVRLINDKLAAHRAAMKELLTVVYENRLAPPRKPGPATMGSSSMTSLMSDRLALLYGLHTKRKALNNLKEWHLKYRLAP